MQVEVALKRIGILKTECAVLPPLNNVVALSVEAIGVTKSAIPRMVFKRVVYKKVFPVIAGLSRKKQLGEFI